MKTNSHKSPVGVFVSAYVHEDYCYAKMANGLTSVFPTSSDEYDQIVTGGVPTDDLALGQHLRWAEVRSLRDTKLAATDWTQLPDVPDETSSLWAQYRKDLRDVTDQSDPFSVIWPVPPVAK